MNYEFSFHRKHCDLRGLACIYGTENINKFDFKFFLSLHRLCDGNGTLFAPPPVRFTSLVFVRCNKVIGDADALPRSNVRVVTKTPHPKG